jgi:lysophospholipase L1-like esterase
MMSTPNQRLGASRQNRREFLTLVGVSVGALLLDACSGGAAAPGSSVASSTPPPVSPAMQSLQKFLRAQASPTFQLPSSTPNPPTISWAGPLQDSMAATSLPNGVIVAVTSPQFGGPVRNQLVATLPGNPQVGGYPCVAVRRAYTCKGAAQVAGSPMILRLTTDAPVIELTGVVTDDNYSSQTLIVDGQLVAPTVLSSSRGRGGGWDVATLRIDFGSRQTRDIWLETAMAPAYVKIDQSDTLTATVDAADPQITVVGDSYQLVRSAAFGNGGAIALELGARLGIRKVAVDGIGGTGYWNSGGDVGNLNDRLGADSADASTIYFVMAGLNDYGDLRADDTIDWPARATYEQSVTGYLQALRSANPDSLIVVTAPFCPNPTLSDSTYVAHSATNSSGTGDFLYKAQVQKGAVQQIAGPWIYIDVLMGTGWLNSSGATGDASDLQWFTGGTPAPGTSASNKPGNTNGGGGGGCGGIASVPVLGGGQYSQAPDVTATGGSGAGLLLAARIDAAGQLIAVDVVEGGAGYATTGLPTVTLDSTYELAPALLGSPTLTVGINPNGEYPLPSFAPSGNPNLNNIYTLLSSDETHPSTLGVDYLSSRLAQSLFDALMAL